MDASGYFQGKKVTVMGLGLLGRGVGDARYLASCGAELVITDLKSREELATSVTELADFSNVTFVLGEHRLLDFQDKDFILKAAGVPFDSIYIQEAERNGIPVKMSASLFAEVAQIPVIGVTGTRGKSTVTHMLEAIYKKAEKNVLLGGNVRGVSTLSLLPEVTAESIALFELDSWQLQGFGDANASPSLAIFTTFFPDHLNYYHGDLDAYLADKANIFLYQDSTDTLVLGEQCADLITEKYGERIVSEVLVAGASQLPVEWTLQIPGEHNRYNAGIALVAARASSIPDEVSKAALEGFGGVPGRLELVGTIDGVEIYNDTNSTTPDATVAALKSFGAQNAGLTETKRIILIMGGADKGLQMDSMLAEIDSLAKRVILLAGTGTDRIKSELPNAEIYENLAMAFADAKAHADPGDVILFSPAFASFGMFSNEYDRGDKFVSLVRSNISA
jgi:UDP-N-acetylmuramoylalanine--D-glutamate ligase